MSNLDIITVAHEPSAQRGGLELLQFTICSELSRRGHKLQLLYERPGSLLAKYADAGVQTHPIQELYPTRNVQFLFKLMQTATSCKTRANTVIYTHLPYHAYLSAATRLLKRTRSVMHLHLPPFVEINSKYRFALEQVDKFIAVSNQTKSDWTARGIAADKITVVPQGIDCEPFTQAEPTAEFAQSFMILFVGRLIKWKGVETLLRAFAVARAKVPIAKLVIVGKAEDDPPITAAEYMAILQGLTASLDLTEHVVFAGHQSDIRPLYRAADLVVVPSEWSEPGPLTVLEAMASQSLVIGANIGGIPEKLLPVSEGLLFEPGNVEQLAALIERMAALEKNDASRLTDKALAVAREHFSLARMIDSIEEILSAAAQAK